MTVKLIFLGDFNTTHDHQLDRKYFTGSASSRSNKLTKNELTQASELKDIWRFKIPMKKGFTYFTHRHNSFSRIHTIWAILDLLLDTHHIEILPKILTDHNPILWSINFKRKHSCLWHFNSNPWRDQNFAQQAEITLNFFSQTTLIKVPLYILFGILVKPSLEVL